MKMTFATPYGHHVTAYFDQELLEVLRQDGLGSPSSASIEAFMQQTAERLHEQKNISVCTDSVRQFLFDLQRYNILKPVGDPWYAFAIDGIRWGLRGPLALAGWQHQLIWSNELPYVISTHVAGATRSTPINLSQLPNPNFQQQWLNEHVNALKRLA